MSDLVDVGGLWLRLDKDGQKYMTGRFDSRMNKDAVIALLNNPSASIVILPNKYKQEGSKQPDFRLKFAPPREQAMPAQHSAIPPIQDSDIPF